MFDQGMLQQLLYVHQCLQEMQSIYFHFYPELSSGLQCQYLHGIHVPEKSYTSYVNFIRELKQNTRMFRRKTLI